ncbi:MAG: hypothetical protein AAF456_24335 [Planctomycetota bacterium]
MKVFAENIMGFRAFPGMKFSIQGRSYRLRRNGMQTLALMLQIHELHSGAKSRSVFAISEIRERLCRIKQLGRGDVLMLVVSTTDDRLMKRVAIWLRGHLHGSVGTRFLAKTYLDSDDQIRKEVVRALKRMNAWCQLEFIASIEPNPRVRNIAQAKAARDYSARLEDLTGHMTERVVIRPDSLLKIDPELIGFSNGKTPRTPEQIQEVLLRIRTVLALRSAASTSG